MRTTTLGGDGPQAGVIGLGCMGMTASYDMETQRDEATSIAVIHQALDLGMTLLDTADAYGPYTNEELVGRALTGGHRERAVLACSPTPSRSRTRAAARPGPAGTAARSTSGGPSTAACGGCAPITWTCTSCTGWTRRCRWRRPGERWRRR